MHLPKVSEKATYNSSRSDPLSSKNDATYLYSKASLTRDRRKSYRNHIFKQYMSVLRGSDKPIIISSNVNYHDTYAYSSWWFWLLIDVLIIPIWKKFYSNVDNYMYYGQYIKKTMLYLHYQKGSSISKGLKYDPAPFDKNIFKGISFYTPIRNFDPLLWSHLHTPTSLVIMMWTLFKIHYLGMLLHVY